jgi:chromosome segregation ATPase
MEQESELQRLEKFVEKILTRFSMLKAEKAQLEQEVFERDLLIEELRENISSKVTERNEISQRVNKIVDQIEEWEINLENGEEITTEKASEVTDLNEEQLSLDIQNPEKRSDQDEGHKQHDLFSLSGSRE